MCTLGILPKLNDPPSLSLPSHWAKPFMPSLLQVHPHRVFIACHLTKAGYC
jgi:hypothetical protein